MADQDFSLCPKDGGSGSHKGEIWPRWMSEPVKLSDLPGWRTGQTNENCYRNECLIGNWNEERYDISRQKMIKRLPSDVILVLRNLIRLHMILPSFQTSEIAFMTIRHKMNGAE